MYDLPRSSCLAIDVFQTRLDGISREVAYTYDILGKLRVADKVIRSPQLPQDYVIWHQDW